jgi:hypothetical protein
MFLGIAILNFELSLQRVAVLVNAVKTKHPFTSILTINRLKTFEKFNFCRFVNCFQRKKDRSEVSWEAVELVAQFPFELATVGIKTGDQLHTLEIGINMT